MVDGRRMRRGRDVQKKIGERSIYHLINLLFFQNQQLHFPMGKHQFFLNNPILRRRWMVDKMGDSR